MNQKSISISYKEYTLNEGLDSRDMELLERAQLAAKGSYAPYSNFNVGAAVRLSNGEIVAAIAVTASVDGHICETPTYPCGACRQVLAESEMRAGKPIKVIIGGEKFTQEMESIRSLLPFTFDNLPKR